MQVKYDRKLLIAIGRSRKASQWQNKEMPWSEFLDKLATTTRTRETVAEYAALPKGERDTIKDVGGFVGGYLKNGKRNNASVVNRCISPTNPCPCWRMPRIWDCPSPRNSNPFWRSCMGAWMKLTTGRGSSNERENQYPFHQ